MEATQPAALCPQASSAAWSADGETGDGETQPAVMLEAAGGQAHGANANEATATLPGSLGDASQARPRAEEPEASAVHFNPDGTISQAPEPEIGVVDHISDDESDEERAAVASGGVGQDVELPEEHWASLPEEHREMWERVRPRGLRREAAHLKELRMPVAPLKRLMALHPGLTMQAGAATEAMNCATVLLLQAVVKAAVRERGQGRGIVQIGDVRQACVGAQETQFMHPFENVFDASASIIRVDPHMDMNADIVEGLQQPKVNKPVILAPGQKVLGLSMFEKNKAPEGWVPPEPEPAPPPRVQEPLPPPKPQGLHAFFGKTAQPADFPEWIRDAKAAGKRKAPQSAQRGSAKAPKTVAPARLPAAQAAVPNQGLSGIFGRQKVEGGG